MLLLASFFSLLPLSHAAIDDGPGALKVKKDQESAEEQKRKERKKEKKERREKKSGNNENVEEKKHDSSKRHMDVRSQVSQKADRIEESENLEKSGLTEEHGEAVGHHYSHDSPDSIDDGGKRKKQKVDSDAKRDFSRRLCIRLPSLKSKELQGPNRQACSDSRMISQEARAATTVTTTAAANIFPEIGSEISESLSGTLRTEIALHRDLILNWVPSVQREYTKIDDQEWLFTRPKQQQQQHKQEKRWKGSEKNGNGLSGWFCSATHLPEVDIYALPYTVPY